MLEKLLAMSVEDKIALIRLYDEFDIYEDMINIDLTIIYMDMLDFVFHE